MSKSIDPSQVEEIQDKSFSSDSEQSGGISLADIFRALAKNKWLILVCTLTCLGIAGIYVTVAKPVFEATATLRIDPTRAGSLGLNDLLSLVGSEGSGEQVMTEMSILKSDQVALTVLDKPDAGGVSGHSRDTTEARQHLHEPGNR